MGNFENKILLCVLNYTSFLHSRVATSIFRALGYAQGKGLNVDFRFLQRGMVDRVRQEAHEFALDKGFTHIMWWDDDILAPVETIYQLAQHGKDICSAMMFVRNPPYPMYAYRSTRGHDELDYFQSLTLDERGGVVEVEAVGTGCTMMRAGIVKGWSKPWWRWPEKGAEDIAFCLKHIKAGGKVFVDTSLETDHLTFDPTPINHHAHKAECDKMRAMVKEAPEIKNHPEFHKVEYLINGQKRLRNT